MLDTLAFDAANLEIVGARKWLVKAGPGDRKLYHAGHLSYDRKEGDAVADILGSLMRWASERGLVDLVQVRTAATRATKIQAYRWLIHELGSFDYYAERTSQGWTVEDSDDLKRQGGVA